jgi:hypothetical protein
MRQLDLHGVRHSEVDRIVENFLFQYQADLPLLIICGNSNRMVDLVKRVTDRLRCDTEMIRYGQVIVRNF